MRDDNHLPHEPAHRGPRIKFSGITRPDDARVAGEVGAWAIGVVFVPGDPCFVTAATARAIFDAVPPDVLKFGVFQNQSVEVIRKVVQVVPLDAVQLHGHETNAHCDALGPLQVMKTVILHDESDIPRVCEFAAEFLRVDDPREGLPDRPPGMSLALANQLAHAFPRTIIAGKKMSPLTVASIIETAQPFGVDVSSGIELRPGMKDAGLIRAFAEAAASAESAR